MMSLEPSFDKALEGNILQALGVPFGLLTHPSAASFYSWEMINKLQMLSFKLFPRSPLKLLFFFLILHSCIFCQLWSGCGKPFHFLLFADVMPCCTGLNTQCNYMPPYGNVVNNLSEEKKNNSVFK